MRRGHINLLDWVLCLALEFSDCAEDLPRLQQRIKGYHWLLLQIRARYRLSLRRKVYLKVSYVLITLSIFKAMKGWLRRNHPLFLIHKFKEFKVTFVSLNDVYNIDLFGLRLFIITSDLNFPYNQTIVSCITNQHEGRQVNTSRNFNISYIFLGFVMAYKDCEKWLTNFNPSSWVLLHDVCISD